MPTTMSAWPGQELVWRVASSALLASTTALAAPTQAPQTHAAPSETVQSNAAAPVETEPAESEPSEGEPIDCLAQHVRAQELRLDSRLVEARDLLRACSQPTCPTLVRTDCGSLLAEIQRAVPTVVLELLNPEINPERVSVAVNGHARAIEFGQAYEFDVGAVRLRIEAPGYEPLEETLIVREGEKNRLVPLRLELPGPPPLPMMPPPLGSPPRRTLPPESQEPKTATGEVIPYALAAAALVATATSAYFAWSALDERARLDKRCAPLCSDDEQRNLRRDLLVADIAGGIAVAAGSLSVTLFVLRADSTSGGAAKPAVGGVASTIGGALW